MTKSRGSTSTWIWITTGCLAAIVLLVAVGVGVGYYAFRKAREFRETMEDPVARSRAAREILGAESLPDGYHAVAAFSVPLLMEAVVLSDRPGVLEERSDLFFQRGFVYTKALAFGDQERQIEDFFEGRTDNAELLSGTFAGFRRKEVVASGRLDEPGRTLKWVAHRGELLDGGRSGRPLGLSSAVLIDCAGDERLRLGIWLGVDPDPDAPVERTDFRGSVADPDEIRAFFAGFDVCG